jgi:SAM-dependent methyltransferase
VSATSHVANTPPTPETRLQQLITTYNNRKSESTESTSGEVSDTRHTAAIRKKLAALIADPQYNIKSVLDVGCGDFTWQSMIPEMMALDKYVGVDIVSEVIDANVKKTSDKPNVQFVAGDLMDPAVQQQVLDDQAYDLVIVRDVIQHIPLTDGRSIFEAIDKSKSRYLFTTFHRGASFNNDAGYGGDSHHDVRLKPFNFLEPVAGTQVQEHPFLTFPGNAKGMALWELPALHPDPEPVQRKRRFNRKKKKKGGKKGKKAKVVHEL